MIEINPRRLSKSQRRRLQSETSFSELAEELVAERYDLSEFNDADWYDCINKETGTKYEVKSTQSTIGDTYTAKGRFRLWRDNHRSLAASHGQGTAWYAFVFLDEKEGVLRIQRRKPPTVTRIISEEGGWNQSGHDRGSKQIKLPVSTVMY